MWKWLDRLIHPKYRGAQQCAVTFNATRTMKLYCIRKRGHFGMHRAVDNTRWKEPNK